MGWIIAVSLFFGVTRFFFAGHAVSPWGSWEAFAHIWVGVLLTLIVQDAHTLWNDTPFVPMFTQVFEVVGSTVFCTVPGLCLLVISGIETVLFLIFFFT